MLPSATAAHQLTPSGRGEDRGHPQDAGRVSKGRQGHCSQRVHQLVNDREAKPTFFPGRLVLPPAVVADGDGDAAVRDRSHELDQMRGRLLGVLDCVGERLGHSELNLEQLTTRYPGLVQPPTELKANNGDRFRQRLEPELQRRLGLSQIQTPTSHGPA